MSDFKGDYMGFSFGTNAEGNPMHSSDLGIVRTSDGSRFNENLLPTMQDKTVQVPGGDGTYYFGSYFTQRQFSVSFAFNELTEEQVARIKRHFGDKKIHDLVFDERPYKTYRAKVTGTATLKYIPFEEGTTNRLYKGEGTIQFTCYQPYGICSKKWLEDYSNCENIGEWKDASGLVSKDEQYDQNLGDHVHLYNPGDIESHFQLGLYFKNERIPAGTMYINSDRQLAWNEITKKAGDSYIKINSKLNLIEGYNSTDQKTGTLYNEYLAKGAFFAVPCGHSEMTFDFSGNSSDDFYKAIEYNYYYI